jgi:hypothetical protein
LRFWLLLHHLPATRFAGTSLDLLLDFICCLLGVDIVKAKILGGGVVGKFVFGLFPKSGR